MNRKYWNMGSFKNYVNNTYEVGWWYSIFRVKNVHLDVGDQKSSKFCPHSYLGSFLVNKMLQIFLNQDVTVCILNFEGSFETLTETYQEKLF